eukprot:TRINITY_DN6539_c0_g1_i1.p1 TRINITY_DN6539_c0_g1~~TRINITY_DN6539_c0_g1_i1.p1  ORF type:complete len:289 (-),score=35.20 TRINITY_DN6539_c0_g1_i1:36-902(-)
MEWLSRVVERVPFLKSLLLWFICRVAQMGPVPGHVAFIMDGNRRYARQRNQKVVLGHREGGIKLQEMLDSCEALGIHTVTAFAFSLDNFKRSQQEVDDLLNLAVEKLTDNLPELVTKTRVKLFGDVSRVPPNLLRLLEKAAKDSEHIKSSTLNLCFSYTSTNEMMRATRKMVDACAKGTLTENDIDPISFESFLDSSECIEPDVVIRTSGEVRLSDFCLWQTMSSCIYFCQALWPDFSVLHLFLSIIHYQQNFDVIQQRRKTMKRFKESFRSEVDPKTRKCRIQKKDK